MAPGTGASRGGLHCSERPAACQQACRWTPGTCRGAGLGAGRGRRPRRRVAPAGQPAVGVEHREDARDGDRARSPATSPRTSRWRVSMSGRCRWGRGCGRRRGGAGGHADRQGVPPGLRHPPAGRGLRDAARGDLRQGRAGWVVRPGRRRRASARKGCWREGRGADLLGPLQPGRGRPTRAGRTSPAAAEAGWDVVEAASSPDEAAAIRAALLHLGGRGGCRRHRDDRGHRLLRRATSPRRRRCRWWTAGRPGIAELIRLEGLKKTPHACLSRGEAGLRGRTLIVNLPGSLKAVRDGMDDADADPSPRRPHDRRRGPLKPRAPTIALAIERYDMQES